MTLSLMYSYKRVQRWTNSVLFRHYLLIYLLLITCNCEQKEGFMLTEFRQQMSCVGGNFVARVTEFVD